MAGRRDYYQIFGLDIGASSKEIKIKYRSLALQYHPDKNGGSTDATEKFMLIKEAFDLLSDPEKRAHYDKARRSYQKAKRPALRKTASKPASIPASSKSATATTPRQNLSASSQQAYPSRAEKTSSPLPNPSLSFQGTPTGYPQNSGTDLPFQHPHALPIPRKPLVQPPNPFSTDLFLSTPPLQQRRNPRFPFPHAYPDIPYSTGPPANDQFQAFAHQQAAQRTAQAACATDTQYDYNINKLHRQPAVHSAYSTDSPPGSYRFHPQQVAQEPALCNAQFVAEPSPIGFNFLEHTFPEPQGGFRHTPQSVFYSSASRQATGIAPQPPVETGTESQEQARQEVRAREKGRVRVCLGTPSSENASIPRSHVPPPDLPQNPSFSTGSMSGDSVPPQQIWRDGEGIITKQTWKKAASQRTLETPDFRKRAPYGVVKSPSRYARRNRARSEAEAMMNDPAAAEVQQRLFDEALVNQAKNQARANMHSPKAADVPQPLFKGTAVKDENKNDADAFTKV